MVIYYYFLFVSAMLKMCEHGCLYTIIYRVAQKVRHYQMIKNCIKLYLSLSMTLVLFVKLKYQSSTIILFVGIRYSMRDLLSDLNNYMPDPQTGDMRQIR